MIILFIALMWIIRPADAPSAVAGDIEFASGDYPAAVAAYDSLLRTTPDPARIHWRLARVTVCIGDVTDETGKEEVYLKAEAYARACIREDSTVSEGHAWLAAALGNIAMNAGGEQKVKLCNEIKEHLERAITLDPRNDIAWSILGSLYRALGNVSWFERQLANIFLGELPAGGFDDAEKALRQAIGLAPQVIRHHYELATLYRETGRPAQAREEYERAMILPPVLASDPRTQKAARHWIEEMAGDD
jgi:tetratricopeptide (TPR) repeat protein